jgi:uncharacterized membrane protein YeaQ/YmgE (transglycosylase-associated protein family)
VTLPRKGSLRAERAAPRSDFYLLPFAFYPAPRLQRGAACLLLIRNLGGLPEAASTGGKKRMNIIGWILFGLVVGAIAKFLMPGRDPGGWIVTILLGIAGSFVGGFLATTIMGRDQQTAGWIGSIIGAMVLLFIYRLIVGRRRVV